MMSVFFYALLLQLIESGVGLATCGMALERPITGTGGGCRSQAPKDANTRNRMQLDASLYAVPPALDGVASICVYLPEVERQDMYCDITSLLSIPSQYRLTRLWLDADLLCEARSGHRRLGRSA